MTPPRKAGSKTRATDGQNARLWQEMREAETAFAPGGLMPRFLDRQAIPSENDFCAAVAQVVERSPEKAGVGGSTPSRGTTLSARRVNARMIREPSLA
jgi:hypothetical protein